MKLAWMRQDLASVRRATAFLVVLLVGSMLVNLILAIFAVRLSGHERETTPPKDEPRELDEPMDHLAEVAVA